MGLDNGIEIRRKGNLPNCVLCFDDDWWRKKRGCDLEVAYWRKCWNVRNVIYNTLGMPDENDSEIELSWEDVHNIVQALEEQIRYSTYEDWGSTFWTWNEFRGFQKRNIKRLKKLARMMKRHSEIEAIFYDSY
jgi:hypothetical protein